MIYYFFSLNPEKHLIQVEFRLGNITENQLKVQLPAWRPGRYQLQHFAKNIKDFHAYDQDGDSISIQKYKKDGWIANTEHTQTLIIRYSYYASEINAGSSFLNADLLYINPVNLCLYVEERMNEPCELIIHNPEKKKIACGLGSLQSEDHLILKARDFHHVADSPLVMSHYLETITYHADNIPFHFHIHGNMDFDNERLIHDFRLFTENQIRIFGGFPEKDYHFILIVPQHPYYHGVEHRNSTMMVLGPDSSEPEEIYQEILGLASHELFHTWNICKIRPAELLPYDYSKENYFATCFIAEGVTTYYGDKALFDSGVFTQEQYYKELETRYKRHFEESDPASQSLLESSYDLWLDGYEKGIPNRKVSVYHKGAIAAQILDGMIRKKFNGKKSLDDVMRIMWERFGRPFKGYLYKDYQDICEEVFEGSLSAYFKKIIESNESVLHDLNGQLKEIQLYVERDAYGMVKLKSLSEQ